MASSLLQSIPSGAMKQVNDIAKQFIDQKLGMLKEFGEELLGSFHAPGEMNPQHTAMKAAAQNTAPAKP